MELRKVMFRVAFGAAFSALVGLPFITSEMSFIWHMFKFNVQQINCMTDVQISMTDGLSNVEQGNEAQQLNDIRNNLVSCRKEVDINKGSLEFGLEQYKRYNSSQ
jgi:fructose/tagatose bisphosphate aldolase